jgi:cell shape-determining protein MreC
MKTEKLKWFLVVLILTAVCPIGKAYIVHDPIHTVLNVLQQVIGQVKQELQHAEDVAKYAEMIQKEMQQIQQLTTMINQNTEQLRRIGDPNTYVNMLGLDTLFNEMSRINNGAGTTIAEFQRTADGILALKYTASGLYKDLSTIPDRFGKTVQYDANSFKKFGTVQDMYRSFNAELEQANQSLGALYQEKRDTLQQLNSAGSLIEVEKHKAKLQAVQTSIDNVTARMNMAAQKVLVQHATNQNDQARMQQAILQQRWQEAEEEDQEMHKTATGMIESLLK